MFSCVLFNFIWFFFLLIPAWILDIFPRNFLYFFLSFFTCYYVYFCTFSCYFVFLFMLFISCNFLLFIFIFSLSIYVFSPSFNIVYVIFWGGALFMFYYFYIHFLHVFFVCFSTCFRICFLYVFCTCFSICIFRWFFFIRWFKTAFFCVVSSRVLPMSVSFLSNLGVVFNSFDRNRGRKYTHTTTSPITKKKQTKKHKPNRN